MSNRQARIARKQAQKEGTEAFVHTKPQQRVLGPAQSWNQVKNRNFLYYGSRTKKMPSED